VAERRVRALEVSGPLEQGRPRPFGITAAAVILILLSSGLCLVMAAEPLRCTVQFATYPPQCGSAMSQLVQHGWHGYIVAGFVLAFSVLPLPLGVGVVAGVRLLGLRSRGLALGVAGVGILLWLGGPGRSGYLGNPPGGFATWPGSAYDMSNPSVLAIKGLAVAGYVYVIVALLGWRDRFDKATGSVAAPLGTSTLPSSPAPRKSRPGRSRSVVVVVAGAGLLLAGLVVALPGLAVFMDWIAGVVESAAGAGAYCPPSDLGDCLAANGSAGVLGLLAASVGLLGFWAGVRVLRKARTVRAVSLGQRAQPAIVSRP
jgi:hypothetical protein